MALYKKSFEKRSHNVYMPPNIGGYMEQPFQQTVTVTVSEMAAETEWDRENESVEEAEQVQQVLPVVPQKSENLFWISVSGYQLERVGLVYRFFHDIGHLVDQLFTESNLMYLKYLSIPDCEIALSYDGQKIVYGGDILVRVKAENPVLEMKVETAATIDNKVLSNDSQSTVCVIEMEPVSAPESKTKNLSINSITAPAQPRAVRKTGFLQWLKHKVFYMFYYY